MQVLQYVSQGLGGVVHSGGACGGGIHDDVAPVLIHLREQERIDGLFLHVDLIRRGGGETGWFGCAGGHEKGQGKEKQFLEHGISIIRVLLQCRKIGSLPLCHGNSQ